MKLVVLVLLLSSFDCAPKKPVHAFIPSNCLGKMEVKDFTKPCKPISDTLAICDGVEIHFYCEGFKK